MKNHFKNWNNIEKLKYLFLNPQIKIYKKITLKKDTKWNIQSKNHK